jgi:hypothetical protein
MKKLLLIPFAMLLLASCTKTGDKEPESIVYHQINKEYVVIQDRELLQQSEDEVSQRIDSILTGLLNVEFISTGQKKFDLDLDGYHDIAFEIVDLNRFNPEGLPEHFDSLAARFETIHVEILDSSTWGYVDALVDGDIIHQDGHWRSDGGVLGTFANAGQFQGRGERFLAFRLPESKGYHYGWIRIYCSQHNDTLRLLDYAFNKTADKAIAAGQME